MAAFGAGTLPNLLAAGLAADRLRRLLVRPSARMLAGALVVVLGIVGLIRIPLVSEHAREAARHSDAHSNHSHP